MRWTVHGEENIYESDWMILSVVDVEPPGSPVRSSRAAFRAAAGTVIWDRRPRPSSCWVPLVITDRWGGDPAGLSTGRVGGAGGGEAVEDRAGGRGRRSRRPTTHARRRRRPSTCSWLTVLTMSVSPPIPPRPSGSSGCRWRCATPSPTGASWRHDLTGSRSPSTTASADRGRRSLPSIADRRK